MSSACLPSSFLSSSFSFSFLDVRTRVRVLFRDDLANGTSENRPSNAKSKYQAYSRTIFCRLLTRTVHDIFQ